MGAVDAQNTSAVQDETLHYHEYKRLQSRHVATCHISLNTTTVGPVQEL